MTAELSPVLVTHTESSGPLGRAPPHVLKPRRGLGLVCNQPRGMSIPRHCGGKHQGLGVWLSWQRARLACTGPWVPSPVPYNRAYQHTPITLEVRRQKQETQRFRVTPSYTGEVKYKLRSPVGLPMATLSD